MNFQIRAGVLGRSKTQAKAEKSIAGILEAHNIYNKMKRF
jgi:hypothetical protein